MAYDPRQVSAYSADDAKRLSKSTNILGGGNASRATVRPGSKLPKAPATPGVNPQELIETPPALQEGAPAVITSRPAIKKLNAAQGTIGLATEAISNQARTAAETETYRQEMEQVDAQRMADADAERTRATADSDLKAGVQGAIDKVKGTPNAEETEEEAPEASGYFNSSGEPISAGASILQPGREGDVQSRIASGMLRTSQDPLEAEYDRRTAQAELAWEKHNSQVEQMLSGTLPLTANQKAQVDSVRKQFDELKSEQDKFNKNFQGGMQILAVNQGIDRYAPDQAMGNLNQAMSDGVMKIGKIDNLATQAITEMEAGFRSDNFAMIDKAYDDYSGYLTERQTAISNIQAAAAAAVKAERDWNYKVQQDEISNTFKQGDLDLRDKQTNIDAAYKEATITLEQKKFLSAELHQQTADRLAAARFSLDRQNAIQARTLQLKGGGSIQFNEQGQPVSFNGGGTIPAMSIDANRLQAVKNVIAGGSTDPEVIRNVLNFSDTGQKIADFTLDEVKGLTMVAQRQAPAPLTNSAGVPMQDDFDDTRIIGVKKIVSTGALYFDPTMYTDDKQRDMAQDMAVSRGIPVLNGPELADAKSLDATLISLANYEERFKKLAPSGPGGKVFFGISGNISKLRGTDYGDDLEAFQNDSSNVLNALRGFSDGGNAKTGEKLIERVERSMPSLDTGMFGGGMQIDDIGSGTKKINQARQQIYAQMQSRMPDAYFPPSGDKIYTSLPELLAAHPERRAQADAWALEGRPADAILQSSNF